MAGEAEGLQIPVSFTLEEARAALKELEAAARAAGKKIGDGLDPGKGGGGGGGKEGGILALKAELGKARSATMFFTSALGEMGEGGRMAQGVIGGLASMLMGGGVVMLGLEAARIGVGLLTQHFTEQAEETKKAKEEAEKHAEALRAMAIEWDGAVRAQMRHASTGENERRYLDAVNKLLDEQTGLTSKLTAAREKYDAMKGTPGNEFFGRNQEVRAEIKTLEGDLDRLGGKLLALGTQRDRGQQLDALARLTAAWNEAQALVRAGMSEEARLVAEGEAAKLAAREKYGLQSSALEQAIDADTSRKIREAREKADADMYRDMAARRDAWIKTVEAQAEEEAKAWRDARQTQADQTVHPFAGDQFTQPGLDPIQQAELDARVEALKREDEEAAKVREAYAAIRREVREMGRESVRSLSGEIPRLFGGLTRGSKAYENAVREAGGAVQAMGDLSAAAFAALMQNELASLSERAGGQALYETAMGLAALARSFWDPSAGKEAALHFASAAQFVAVSGLAGAGAYVIGQNRGMTADERASVAGMQRGNTVPGDTGSREILPGGETGGRGGPTINVYFSGKALVTEPEVKRYLADLMRETRDSGWSN